MIEYVNVEKKQTPVSFSVAALRFWEHKVEKPIGDLLGKLSDVGNSLDSYEMTWLAYSGMKHGHEESTGRAFKLSFNEFCNTIGKDDESMAEITMVFFQEMARLAEERGVDTTELKSAIKTVKDGVKAEIEEKKMMSTSTPSTEPV